MNGWISETDITDENHVVLPQLIETALERGGEKPEMYIMSY